LAIAIAVIGPMPGIDASRRLTSSARWSATSRASIASMRR
jgi:hypothetical protein